MIEKIISFSVQNKLITGILLLMFVGWGIYSATQLSIDALPDVTNNQVQVITNAPNLATQEVEQFITYPIEMQMKTIPDLVELRSTSRSGLSVITVVFKDNVPVNLARQLVAERITTASENIPKNFGIPGLVPPTTGLGEIFQYTLAVDSASKEQYNIMDLRTIQDWIVKRQLLGVPGVVDVSSFGGKLKQYEIAVAAEKLVGMNITLLEVYDALSKNNENSGGSYIDKGPNIYFIRSEGVIQSLADIENIVIKNVNGIPILIRDIAKVQFGFAPRYGAMTRNGEGETVGGVVLMMKGANSVDVIGAVKDRIKQVEKSLPPGVSIDVFVDRTKLIHHTVSTVEENLLIGALIVIFILILLLGNIRAGLIVATVIPLSLLFAISIMNIFGLSANLMSMGALDFGLIVDGAIIIVEGLLFSIQRRSVLSPLTDAREQNLHEGFDDQVISSSTSIMSSAVFGQFIILIVYVPIFALVGIEGKMFQPMAQTVSFAIIGALLLSLTYVPLMASIFLNNKSSTQKSWSERFIHWLQRLYTPSLIKALNWRKMIIFISLLFLGGSILVFQRLGGEFIPELDEGDFAINYVIRQGSNLNQTIAVGTQLERIILDNIPEAIECVSKIGTSEIPTDPMPIETADLLVVMKDKKEWKTATTREGMIEKMNEKMSVIPGVNLTFEQPIQMRFNELIAGVKSAIAVKIYGENLDVLFEKGNEAAKIIAGVPGAVDIKVEQIVGMPQLVVKYDRERIAQFGLNIVDVNNVLNTALAGSKAGVVYEGEKQFDLVVRLADYHDADEEKVKNIFVPLPDGSQIPIGQLAKVSFQSAPAEISRDNGERRLVVEVNVRNRDIQSVAEEIKTSLGQKLNLPPGYYVEYGGTFQNLQEAKGRLAIAVPVALLLIFLLLFLTFRSIKETLIIFSAIPLAAIGGVGALWIRGMNFSISAGIGFIALFGVAVLNGIVLISYLNRLEKEGEKDITQRILKGTSARLRPVLITAAVASFGFLPMALSVSAGSEVQKPLATVVIGGLISSTLLTLIVLPVLYSLFFSKNKNHIIRASVSILIFICLSSFLPAQIKAQTSLLAIGTPRSELGLDSCISIALRHHPVMQSGMYAIRQQEILKKNAFTLDPFTLNYQGGSINSKVNDYNLTFSGSFKYPLVYKRQSQLQEQNILLARQQLEVSKNELLKNVSAAYYELLYAQQNYLLLQKIDSLYIHFAEYATKKYNVGESNVLEKLSAEAQLKQLQLQLQQAQSDIAIAQAQLNQWLGIPGEYYAADIELKPLPPPENADTAQLYQNPVLALEKQKINISIANWKLDKSRYSPSFQLGVFNQSIDKVTPFWGWDIGIAVPIVKSGKSVQSNAALMQINAEESNLQASKLSFHAAYMEALQQYKKFSESYHYFESEGMPMSRLLISTAEKSYQSGEIGYVEYIQNINTAYTIQSQYLETIKNLNGAIININYLLNK